MSAFSKTRAPRGRSPLGPSIQTDLLCWGVISTGWLSPPLLPSFLGPPNGRRLMSTRNFVPHFLQSPPDPPCSWKTLAPAQRAPMRPRHYPTATFSHPSLKECQKHPKSLKWYHKHSKQHQKNASLCVCVKEMNHLVLSIGRMLWEEGQHGDVICVRCHGQRSCL